MITRGSAEGGLIVMVGSAVNVICQHRAEMSSRKEANAYLEKQVPTNKNSIASCCFQGSPTLERTVMTYSSGDQVQTNQYIKV